MKSTQVDAQPEEMVDEQEKFEALFVQPHPRNHHAMISDTAVTFHIPFRIGQHELYRMHEFPLVHGI